MSTAIATLKKLEAVGFEHNQAAAIVEAVEVAETELATKSDLAQLETRLETRMAQMETRLYRALWVQFGAIIAAVAGLLAIIQRLTQNT